MTEAHPLGPNPEFDVMDFDPVSPVYQIMEVLISPKLAEHILETRAPNRPLRRGVVEKYAVDMKKKHWLRNGQTIKFDQHGRLLDGQHRLWAIIEADIAVDMTVAVGLEPEAMATVDTGVPRTFADVLAINSMANSRDVAAVLRLIWTYETSEWGRTTSNLELGAVLSRFTDLPDFVSENVKRLRKLGTAAAVHFVCYMGSRLDPEEGRRFIEGLTTGIDLEEGSPILAFRERLLSWKSEQGTTKRDLPIMVGIKAWNKFYADESVTKLQWQPTKEGRIVFDPAVPGLRNPAPARILKG